MVTRGRVSPFAMTALAVAAFWLGCAPTPAARQETAPAPANASSPAGPRGTVRVALGPEPPMLASKFVNPGSTSMNEMAIVFNSSLVSYDPSGGLHPQLATDVPTQDNGGWTVNADGTMVTTYHLRDNARWHDGTPITAEDYVFAYQVYSDPDVAVTTRTPEDLMSSVTAPDSLTVQITWKQPYFRANGLSYKRLEVLPRHLLAQKYEQGKSDFVLGSQWTTDYVGSGPFRLEHWEPGAQLTARAFSDWVLGAPKLDRLEVHFIPDVNTILANLLSDSVDISTTPYLGIAAAWTIRDQWLAGTGYMNTWASKVEYMEFQFRDDVDTRQRAIADPRVRQALLYGLDREGLADLVNHGVAGPANAFFLESDPLYGAVDAAIAKYPYEPDRAASLLADAGWRRPAGTDLVRNAAGETLDLPLWNTAGSSSEQINSFIGSNWKDVGVDSSAFIIPAARAQDAQFIATFPAAALTNRIVYPENFVFTAANTPAPENRYQGANRGGFSDPEVERLQTQVVQAITAESMRESTVALHARMSQVVGIGPLYYFPDLIMARNSIKGTLGNPNYQMMMWNVADWSEDGQG